MDNDIPWCSGAYTHLSEYRFTGVTVAVCPECGNPTPLTEMAIIRPHPKSHLVLVTDE